MDQKVCHHTVFMQDATSDKDGTVQEMHLKVWREAIRVFQSDAVEMRWGLSIPGIQEGMEGMVQKTALYNLTALTLISLIALTSIALIAGIRTV